jgi:membrane-bound inhibitor of C-type lysozyme
MNQVTQWGSIGIFLLIASVMGGCAAPAPVIITEAEQSARLVFTCPNAKTLEVTRAQAGQLAIVVVDGKTLQLPRVANAAGLQQPAERWIFGTVTMNR